MTKRDLNDFVIFLKEKGYSPQEITLHISVATVGQTMTRAIVEFSSRYDSQSIDGFPESSIQILEECYGERRLRRMTPKTIAEKVYALQRTVTERPDEEEIAHAINYYLG